MRTGDPAHRVPFKRKAVWFLCGRAAGSCSRNWVLFISGRSDKSPTYCEETSRNNFDTVYLDVKELGMAVSKAD